MKLFEITDGRVGESYLRVFVLAKNEDSAITIAKRRYKHEDGYVRTLNVEVLCDDATQEWASEVRDY